MKDIRMPTPFTTSNAEETGMGALYGGQRKRKRRERDGEMKVSNKNYS